MNKTIVKNVAVVTVGVLIAGAIMYAARDVEFVDNIRTGFGN